MKDSDAEPPFCLLCDIEGYFERPVAGKGFSAGETIFPAVSINFRLAVHAQACTGITGERTSALKASKRKNAMGII